MKLDNKKILLILVSIIVLLLLVLAYFFLINPAINNSIIKYQTEGIQYAVYSIMQQASQCNQVPLTFGNTTMNLVWTNCLTTQD